MHKLVYEETLKDMKEENFRPKSQICREINAHKFDQCDLNSISKHDITSYLSFDLLLLSFQLFRHYYRSHQPKTKKQTLWYKQWKTNPAKTCTCVLQ